MPKSTVALALGALLAGETASAQVVIEGTEVLDFDRPEAWAMAYASAATLYHGMGVPDRLEPGTLRFAAELGHIPEIDEEDTRVGFDGTKFEDLNKSPVFGRGRLWIGLPAAFSLELAYTPPVSIDGARADGIYGLALGRPLWRGEGWRLGARAFAQGAHVRGDFTCTAETAAFGEDLENNPFGCRATSSDTAEFDYYGVELSAAWERDGFSPFAAWSVARLHPEVQVNAPVFTVIDRTRLVTEGTIRSGLVGVEIPGRRGLNWTLAAAYTPLDVVRPPASNADSDDFWSLRLMLSWTPSAEDG